VAKGRVLSQAEAAEKWRKPGRRQADYTEELALIEQARQGSETIEVELEEDDVASTVKRRYKAAGKQLGLFLRALELKDESGTLTGYLFKITQPNAPRGSRLVAHHQKGESA
jgi:hypothetical protein